METKFPKQADAESHNDCEENQTDHDESEIGEDGEIEGKICITLKNNNKKTIKQRQRNSFKVIRYVRFNKKTDSENFHRERLVLFYPRRNETSDLKKTL